MFFSSSFCDMFMNLSISSYKLDLCLIIPFSQNSYILVLFTKIIYTQLYKSIIHCICLCLSHSRFNIFPRRMYGESIFSITAILTKFSLWFQTLITQSDLVVFIQTGKQYSVTSYTSVCNDMWFALFERVSRLFCASQLGNLIISAFDILYCIFKVCSVNEIFVLCNTINSAKLGQVFDKAAMTDNFPVELNFNFSRGLSVVKEKRTFSF